MTTLSNTQSSRKKYTIECFQNLPGRVAIQRWADPYIVRLGSGVIRNEASGHIAGGDLDAIGVVHAAGPWGRDAEKQLRPLG